jgi:NCS1 family nucleobase:cation symporter-1
MRCWREPRSAWSGPRVPAVARAIVACGWYGIQTWIGGGALLTLLGVILGRKLEGAPIPLLGIGVGQLLSFLPSGASSCCSSPRA